MKKFILIVLIWGTLGSTSALAASGDLKVLDERAFPSRDVLELMGDGKTGDFGRPLIDFGRTDAMISRITDGPNHSKSRYLEFTGDNCGSDGNCFVLAFYKSYHGLLDLSMYTALEFDVMVEENHSANIGIRIGSYPSRAEINISSRLPQPGQGWKHIRLTMKEFMDNVYEGYSPDMTEDVFSIGTQDKITLRLANIRWVR